ncbi:MAG: ArsR/SmtB family transcription factor [Myxococcota bacterium]
MTLANEDQLNRTFSALAHPTRRAILLRLAQSDADVGELARPFNTSLPAISRHIRVLEQAGLLQQGQRAQARPCALNAAPLVAATDWTHPLRQAWEARFDRMDLYLQSINTQEEE